MTTAKKPKKSDTSAPRRRRRAVTVVEEARLSDDDDHGDSVFRVEKGAKLAWPEQLELVRETSRFALHQSNAKEAVTIAQFLVDIGVKVLENLHERPIIMLIDGEPLHRLIQNIHKRAEESDVSTDEVIEALLTKLGVTSVGYN